MPLTQFNRHCKMNQIDPDAIVELKKARRRKKNRLYAQRSRERKIQR